MNDLMHHAVVLLMRYTAILLTFVCAMTTLTTMARASEPTDQDARQILKQRAFPWYDSTKEAYRPLKAVKEPAKPAESSRLPDLNVGAPSAAYLMWVLLAALVIVGIVALVVSVYQIDLNLDSEAKPQQATIDVEKLEALPEPARGVRDLLAEAERLAASSSYSAAMTFYYSWQLIQLDTQQSIEVHRGKTNRQYAREVRSARPELFELFGRSIRLFEDAFFGHLTITQTDFQQVWSERGRFNVVKRGVRE